MPLLHWYAKSALVRASGRQSALERRTEGSSAYVRSEVFCLRWNVKRTISRPIHVRLAYEHYFLRRAYCQRSAVSIGTYDRRLTLLSTYGLRTNATLHVSPTINAVQFRVFRWNAGGRLASLVSMHGFRLNVSSGSTSNTN